MRARTERAVWLAIGAVLLGAFFTMSAFTAEPADPVFDQRFLDETLRIDYYHGGDDRNEFITWDNTYREGAWAGSRTHLIDRFNLGRYGIKVRDAATGALLFSRGYDSYFGEYRTTAEAAQGVRRVYHETALVPRPKKPFLFEVEARRKDNSMGTIFSREIDPNSPFVLKRPPTQGVKVIDGLVSGDAHAKVDLAVVAEGYTAAEEAKVRKDLDRLLHTFFRQEPYKTMKDQFNVRCVFQPSDESGCNEPSHGVYKRTVVECTFDSLGSERYLLTEQNRKLRDLTAHVPCDAVIIMVNHDRYGGGGIYNFFCTFTTDNQWAEYLLLHEFGHSFAGLADEYYTSATAYNEFYPKGVEPLEPNITALLDPANVKWKDVLSPGVQVPTPWEKEGYDREDLAYQKVRQEMNEKIARMKRSGAPAAEVAKVVEESEKLSLEQAKKMDAYLAQSRFVGKVGVFEGAGYATTGLYRSMLDCIMFSKGTKPYCQACEAVVKRTIRHYTE